MNIANLTVAGLFHFPDVVSDPFVIYQSRLIPDGLYIYGTCPGFGWGAVYPERNGFVHLVYKSLINNTQRSCGNTVYRKNVISFLNIHTGVPERRSQRFIPILSFVDFCNPEGSRNIFGKTGAQETGFDPFGRRGFLRRGHIGMPYV